jgi:hypothetical protein
VRRVFLRGTRRLVTCHARCPGRVFASARTRGMPCRAGLGIMGKTYASVAKSTTIRAPRLEQWEAAPNSQRERPPSQRHAACKLHSIGRNREGDDELSRPEGPVASLPARIAFPVASYEKPTMTPVASCLWMTPRREPLFWNLPPRVHAHLLRKCVLTTVHPLEEKGAYWPASRRALQPPRSRRGLSRHLSHVGEWSTKAACDRGERRTGVLSEPADRSLLIALFDRGSKVSVVLA